MSLITEVLTGDPWELAKVVRRLGRRCRELGEKRDAAAAQRDQLEREWSSCALEYKQALGKLEEALIAPAPHERPMTATEVNSLQQGALEGTGEPWDRRTVYLTARLAQIWHQFEHCGGPLEPFAVSMRELERLRVRAGFRWFTEGLPEAPPRFNGVPLRIVSDPEIDVPVVSESRKTTAFHD